ncbi:MAG: hypothetical protein QF609_09420 [Gammaproteobacteria bacterium]|jgi:hypothetical protein|nr:hypothetical protein [Gammaproteobacteria bacterium]
MLSALIAGCTQSTNVRVDSELPVALVEKLPLTVGVYYDDAIRDHSYTEDTTERPNWVIDSGDSQVALFDRVLASTFDRVIALENPQMANSQLALDLVIAPSIREMQFATPDETFFDFYEAWIQYDIDMLRPDGSSIDAWKITAYGKSPKRRFVGRSDGLNSAIGLALRDVGAKLSTGMFRYPAIKQLLEKTR